MEAGVSSAASRVTGPGIALSPEALEDQEVVVGEEDAVAAEDEETISCFRLLHQSHGRFHMHLCHAFH